MRNMTAKVLFEIGKDAKINMEIKGDANIIKAGIMTLINQMAEMEGVKTLDLYKEMVELQKLKESNPLSKAFEKVMKDLSGKPQAASEDKADTPPTHEEEMDCDGDCENCTKYDTEEMDPEVKDLLNKLKGWIN